MLTLKLLYAQMYVLKLGVCFMQIIGCSGNSSNKQHWSHQLQALCTYFTCYQLIKHLQPYI